MKWKRDWGLNLRMVGVMLLTGALYVGFASVLAMHFDAFVAVAVAVGLLSGAQFLWGHKIALKSMGGRVVSDREYPELHARVQRLSQQADLPVPEVAVADTKMPNAFAAGRSKKTAVVCVTTGLLDALDGEELDGVIAHELAHVQHRDMAIMTIASAITTMAYWVVRWGWIVNDDKANQHFLPVVASSFVVWISSFLVLRLLSRYREYAADRGAAMITGNPAALASALHTINGTMAQTPKEDLREHAGMSAMMFEGVENRITKYFSTHPAVENRVERLKDLERELAQN
jgi:heat shock protein HtpX